MLLGVWYVVAVQPHHLLLNPPSDPLSCRYPGSTLMSPAGWLGLLAATLPLLMGKTVADSALGTWGSI